MELIEGVKKYMIEIFEHCQLVANHAEDREGGTLMVEDIHFVVAIRKRHNLM